MASFTFGMYFLMDGAPNSAERCFYLHWGHVSHPIRRVPCSSSFIPSICLEHETADRLLGAVLRLAMAFIFVDYPNLSGIYF